MSEQAASVATETCETPNAAARLMTALRNGRLEGPTMRIDIVGITGTEGCALAHLLSRRLGDSVTLVGHDFSSELEASFNKAHVAVEKADREPLFASLTGLPQLEIRSGERYLDGIEASQLVFAGQNWRAYPANAPKLFEAHESVPFAQMMDLYLELAPCPTVAITGTNGKTTTSNWLCEMASRERAARVSGNDLFSRQSLSELFEMAPESLLILEVSNRQARALRRSSPIVAVTSLAPDHVDEHGSYEAYLAAKRRLVELQPADGLTLLNYDDETVRSWRVSAPGEVQFASAKPLPADLSGAFATPKGELKLRIAGEETVLCVRADVSLPGRHNLTNALLAALSAHAAGVSLEAIRAGLTGFRGVKNRLQRVLRSGDVGWFNDLASTTPWATLAALRAFPEGGTWLIVGGKAKAEEGYRELAEAITAHARHLIVFPGTAGEAIVEHLPAEFPLTQVESIDDAVSHARDGARPGDQVLLSPAGAGFYSSFLGKTASFNRSVRRAARRAALQGKSA